MSYSMNLAIMCTFVVQLKNSEEKEEKKKRRSWMWPSSWARNLSDNRSDEFFTVVYIIWGLSRSGTKMMLIIGPCKLYSWPIDVTYFDFLLRARHVKFVFYWFHQICRFKVCCLEANRSDIVGTVHIFTIWVQFVLGFLRLHGCFDFLIFYVLKFFHWFIKILIFTSRDF